MAAMILGPMHVIFAIVLPPLSVFYAVGLRSQFWLNLVFTLLGYVPGMVHAFHVLLAQTQNGDHSLRPGLRPSRLPCTGQMPCRRTNVSHNAADLP
jgi:uncharacterized membrane protein YqaE (UPF0057 family)